MRFRRSPLKINYYVKKLLRQVEITQACPGCGRMDNLAMRDRVISYTNDKTEYYVGCNCGWMGPTADNPIMAAVKWEARSMFVQRSLAQFANELNKESK